MWKEPPIRQQIHETSGVSLLLRYLGLHLPHELLWV